MTEVLRFATAVVYTDDVSATVAFYRRVTGLELAFWTQDVAAAFRTALAVGATALTPPRVMPWGQTVAYVEAPEGTIVGFVTRIEGGAQG